MSRFYVGQRVRIIHATKYPEMIGMECVVYALDVRAGDPGDEFRGIGLNVRTPIGRPAVAEAYQLEPITDSYDKSTWDQCVWKPEHLRVGV